MCISVYYKDYFAAEGKLCNETLSSSVLGGSRAVPGLFSNLTLLLIWNPIRSCGFSSSSTSQSHGISMVLVVPIVTVRCGHFNNIRRDSDQTSSMTAKVGLGCGAGRSSDGKPWWLGVAPVRGFDLGMVGCKYVHDFWVLSAMRGCHLFTRCRRDFWIYFVAVLAWYSLWDDRLCRCVATSFKACGMQWCVVVIWEACCRYGIWHSAFSPWALAKYLKAILAFSVLFEYDEMIQRVRW